MSREKVCTVTLDLRTRRRKERQKERKKREKKGKEEWISLVLRFVQIHIPTPTHIHSPPQPPLSPTYTHLHGRRQLVLSSSGSPFC